MTTTTRTAPRPVTTQGIGMGKKLYQRPTPAPAKAQPTKAPRADSFQPPPPPKK